MERRSGHDAQRGFMIVSALVVGFLVGASLGWAAPPEGKGNQDNPGQSENGPQPSQVGGAPEDRGGGPPEDRGDGPPEREASPESTARPEPAAERAESAGRPEPPAQEERRAEEPPRATPEPPGQADRAGGPPDRSESPAAPRAAERAADRAAERAAEPAHRAAERAAEQGERAVERAAERAEGRPADPGAARASKVQETRTDRLHPHQERRAQDDASEPGKARAEERGAEHVRVAQASPAQGRGADHGLRGREAAQQHVDELLQSLNKLEHARWDYHPHDTRGQGNMGKVDMRDPYGFDKDSGREGAERGRPIRVAETVPTPNAAELTVVDFQVTNWGLIELQLLYNAWLQWASWYSTYYPDWYALVVNYYQTKIAEYEQGSIDLISVFDRETIDYTLTLPEGFDGSTLLVTTRLTSLSTYDDVAYGTYSGGYLDETTGWWIYDEYDGSSIQSIHYEVGQVVVEDTQEITLNGQDTFSVSYLPSVNLVGDQTGWFDSAEGGGQGFLAELSVTITDPVSGASYTYTYDRDINLYRCPYGIVYDTATGRPVVGATVTVHQEDGSIVALDKAANPNASNPQTTDATGRYNAKLAIGQRYYLTVQAPGYQEYRSPVFSERWHIVREDVGLMPAQPTTTTSAPAGVAMPAVGTSEPGTSLQPVLGIGTSPIAGGAK